MARPDCGYKGLSPIIGAGPLPVTRLDSHKISVPDYWLVEQDHPVENLQNKLAAEASRLARLTPEPPAGYTWVFTTYMEDSPASNEVKFVTSAELKEAGYE